MMLVRLPELFCGSCRTAAKRLRAEFQQSLPHHTPMFERSERASRLGFSADARIYNSAAVMVARCLVTLRNADLIVVINQGWVVKTGARPVSMAKKGFFHRPAFSQCIK